MESRAHWLIALLAAVPAISTSPVMAAAPLGSEFSYQGRLQEAGIPVNGTADFEFTLWDAADGGNQVGVTQSVDNVGVVDGLFSVALDFGVEVFNGDARWLEVAVRSPGGEGEFTTLSPRNAMSAAPYALQTRGIFVDEEGRAGIGTTTPHSPLTVTGPNNHGVDSSGIVLQNTTEEIGRSWLLGSSAEGLFQIADMSNNSVTRFVVDERGYVGIGTITPKARLHAAGQSLWLTNGVGGGLGRSAGAGLRLYFSEAQDFAHIFAYDYNNSRPRNIILQEPGGSVGVGTDSPVEEFHVKGNGGVIAIEGNDHAYIEYYPDGVGAGRKAYLGFSNSTSNDFTIRNEVDGEDINLVTTGGGVTRVSVLEITGADLAERFPTSETNEIEPGTVMAIDPDNPGKLRISRGAYNRHVAGVVSGANDLSVGAVLGNLPGHDDAPAIALSGRVYVKCDAATEAIEPGDLLTTAHLPGHAMKATDSAAEYGAVIGKAMGGLPRGERGLVLVLVNLQ